MTIRLGDERIEVDMDGTFVEYEKETGTHLLHLQSSEDGIQIEMTQKEAEQLGVFLIREF